MTDKQQLFLVIGAIGIFIIAILFTPNPVFTGSDLLGGKSRGTSENIIQDASFSMAADSAWRLSNDGKNVHLNKDAVTGIETATTTADTSLPQVFVLPNPEEVTALEIHTDIQNTTENGNSILSLHLEERTTLFTQVLPPASPGSYRVPLTPELRKKIQEAAGKVVLELALPRDSVIRLGKVEVIRLYDLKTP